VIEVTIKASNRQQLREAGQELFGVPVVDQGDDQDYYTFPLPDGEGYASYPKSLFSDQDHAARWHESCWNRDFEGGPLCTCGKKSLPLPNKEGVMIVG